MLYLFFVELSGVLMPVPPHLVGKVRIVPNIMPRDMFGPGKPPICEQAMGPNAARAAGLQPGTKVMARWDDQSF
jgi:hypothetical protein